MSVSFNLLSVIRALTSGLTGGTTAFTCPYEGCGRSFSVQSNMRRHARVHTRGAEAAGVDVDDMSEGSQEDYPSSEGSSPNSQKSRTK